MDCQLFLQSIRNDAHYRGQIAHVEHLPARAARWADPRQPLAGPLARALASLGIHQLYTHQASALDFAREGLDTAIVTSTASGKTLCYNLPVLEELLSQPQRRALYLYPTKALAQDQHKALERLVTAAPGLSGCVKSGVYDGDTPQSTRRRLRDEAQILLSNPDMLHSGILPYHTRWARFWANLGTVVIDEVHTYRGIFGSNVANVLRRLQRICDQYGSKPRFVCCSATIANPAEHAARLIGRGLSLVDDDGSPKGEKWFVFWNAPHLDEARTQRASANVEAERLMVALIQQGAPTIAFGRARIVAELLYRYVREQLQRQGSRLANAVRPYRGGYLAAERREIERQLFSGELMGVTSTNALELGIDIGGLDAAIIVGFPGTVASTWQQAGRAGRGTDPSLVFFIAYNDPVDQFIIRRPEYIVGTSPESAVIDPENPYVLAGHLGCAAAEMPLRPDDARYFGGRTAGVAQALTEEGRLKDTGGTHFWAQPHQPSHRVSLRTVSDDTFTILETSAGNQVIGQVDAISAPELVYPEAVYLHEGQTHFVERLDTLNKVAYVRREEMDYYTQAILESLIRVKGTEREKRWSNTVVTADAATNDARTRIAFGEVEVSWATVGFKKIQFYSTDSLGWGKVDLPSQTLETTGVWLVPSEAVVHQVRAVGGNPSEGLVGIKNASVHLLPLYAMCDKADIGGMVDTTNTGRATLFLYDRYHGGLGFSETAYDRIEELLQACLQLILECDCRDGCPSCVGVPTLRPPIHTDPDAGGGFPIPSKESAVLLLRALLEEAAVLLPDGSS